MLQLNINPNEETFPYLLYNKNRLHWFRKRGLYVTYCCLFYKMAYKSNGFVFLCLDPEWQEELYEPRNLATSYYHEIVSFNGKYSPLNRVFNPDERKLLLSLTKIRNKIAHMQVISKHEFKVLSQCHDLVSKYVHL